MKHIRCLFIFGSALFMLGLIGVHPSTAHAQVTTDASQPPRPTDPPSTPDPRWIALVKGETEAVRAPQALTPTINLNLTDGYVAGRVALPNPVSITVTRYFSEYAEFYSFYFTAQPTPDDDGFFYQAYLRNYNYYYQLISPNDIVQVSQATAAVSLTVPTFTSLAAPISDTVYGTAPLSATLQLYLYSASTETTFTQTTHANNAGLYQFVVSPTLDLRPRETGYVVYPLAPGQRLFRRFAAPALRAQLGGCSLTGVTAPASDVYIKTFDPSGQLVAQSWSQSDGEGNFSLDYYYWDCNIAYHFEPGYRLRVEAAGQVLETPIITLTAQPEVALGQLTGLGPPGQSLALSVINGPLTNSQDEYDHNGDLWRAPRFQTTFTVAANGQYTVSVPWQNADYGAVFVTPLEGYEFFTRFSLPHLHLYLSNTRWGEHGFTGQITAPFTPLTITVQGPSGFLKGQIPSASTGNGFFSAKEYELDNAIRLGSGDVITVSTARGVQVVVPVPPLTAEVQRSSKAVVGQATPNAVLQVTINFYAPVYPHYGHLTQVVTATATGNYQALFALPDSFNQVWGEVSYHTPAGHQLTYSFETPNFSAPCWVDLDVQVGSNRFGISRSSYRCPDTFSARLYDASQHLKAEAVWYEREFYTASVPVLISPGDRLELVNFSDPIEVFYSRIIPTLTVQLDAAANVVSGTASPTTMVDFVYWANTPEEGAWENFTQTVSAQGTYSLTLDQRRLAAGDSVRATVRVENGSFYAIAVVPLVQVNLYQAQVTGWLPPLTPYTFTLAPPTLTTTLVISGSANADGYFTNYLRHGWQPWPIWPGDRLTLTTPTYQWQALLPSLSVQVDREQRRVTGQATPNSQVWVKVMRALVHSQWVSTTATGAYTASVDFALGPDARVEVRHFIAPDLQLYLQATPSLWNVTLGSPCVGFQPATLLQGSLHFALRRGETTLEETDGYGYSSQFTACFTRSIQPNDTLGVFPLSGPVTFTVPAWFAQYDFARQAVFGQVAPNRPVGSAYQTSIYDLPQFQRQVGAEASGQFGFDVSDLDWRLGETYYVLTIDSQGNYIQQTVTVLGYPLYLPLINR